MTFLICFSKVIKESDYTIQNNDKTQSIISQDKIKTQFQVILQAEDFHQIMKLC